MRKSSLSLIALPLGLWLSAPAMAQQVASFESDGCLPGFTAEGTFVDADGTVIPSEGFVATPEGKVLDALGRQVILRENCLAGLETTGGLGATGIGAVIAIGVGAAALGGGGSSNGTN